MLAMLGSETISWPFVLRSARHSRQDAVGRAQVLQNIQQQHAIEAFASQSVDHRRDSVVQVGAEELLESGGIAGLGQQIHAGDAVAVFLQRGREIALAAADIEDFLIASHQAPNIIVAGIFAALDGVMDEIFGEFRAARHGAAGALIAADRAENVTGVLHSVDVTNLGAVIRRNGHFGDCKSLVI